MYTSSWVVFVDYKPDATSLINLRQQQRYVTERDWQEAFVCFCLLRLLSSNLWLRIRLKVFDCTLHEIVEAVREERTRTTEQKKLKDFVTRMLKNLHWQRIQVCFEGLYCYSESYTLLYRSETSTDRFETLILLIRLFWFICIGDERAFYQVRGLSAIWTIHQS